ncbi:hypothetical protein [Cytobacillus sp. FSL K6-0265]|uniref:hypothetical protein n=1 Tax=Cytobacillus sp. FSL K6-0265 TaxID=2921448 RepID=UPI0030F646E5
MKEFILSILNIILPVVTGLGGAFIGGYFTRKGQMDLLDKEILREEMKEKRRDAIDRMRAYNHVMNIDGEKLLVEYIGGSQVEFDIKTYQNEIRPIIYENFHLINRDIAELILKIDNRYQECAFNEEISWEDHKLLADDYFKIIRLIKVHTEEYRKQNITHSYK